MSEDWIDELTETWQSQGKGTASARAPLKTRALLEGIRFWGVLAIELVVALTACSYGVSLLSRGATIRGGILITAMVATMAAGLWVRRGQWRVDDASPRAFLELEVRRARGRRQSVTVGWGVLVVVVAYLGGSLWFELGREAARGLVLLGAMTALYVVVLLYLGKRSRRELARSQALLEDLGSEEAV